MCSGWSDSVLPCLSFSSVDVPCTQVNTHFVTLKLNCGEMICWKMLSDCWVVGD